MSNSDDDQVKRFKEAAQRIADEDGISLDEALRRVMQSPPKHKPDNRHNGGRTE